MTVEFTKEKIMRHLQFILILLILGLLMWSKPWDASSASADVRTITVSGEAVLDAAPDEFVFYPYFEEKGTDEEAMKSRLTTKANAAVTKLKELGVAEEQIELDVSSYDYWYWDDNEDGTLQARINVTVGDKDTAQEVQDYLLTLDIKGQITPQGTFSSAKQKELETEATEIASKDARAKAEAQALLFDAKLGDVVSVNQNGDGGGYPIAYTSEIAGVPEAGDQSLPVLQGQNEYRQTVNVVYELR